MNEEVKFSPFVYWAQSESEISLRVELNNVKFPKIDIQEEELTFSAIGIGARGETNYGFHLEFSNGIDTETSRYKVTDRQIDFSLKKLDNVFWSRLLKSPYKPAWLKIDFEKWQHEEDLDEEVRDIMDDYPDLYEKMQAEEMDWTSKRETMKKVYLCMYNFWQFVGFLYVVSVIATRYMQLGPESIEGTFEKVSWMLTMCFMTQFLEILHPIVGYTRGSVIEPLIQICGRGIIFYCLIVSEERMQEKPVVCYLFLVWSIIEVVRYPFYLLRVYDMEFSLLTWLRYTMWVPLYPLGFVLEGIVILRSIPYLEETQLFTISLPNSMNFAFHFPSFLRIYLLFFFFPIMYKMLAHMYRLRKKKLGGHTTKKITKVH